MLISPVNIDANGLPQAKVPCFPARLLSAFVSAAAFSPSGIPILTPNLPGSLTCPLLLERPLEALEGSIPGLTTLCTWTCLSPSMWAHHPAGAAWLSAGMFSPGIMAEQSAAAVSLFSHVAERNMLWSETFPLCAGTP